MLGRTNRGCFVDLSGEVSFSNLVPDRRSDIFLRRLDAFHQLRRASRTGVASLEA